MNASELAKKLGRSRSWVYRHQYDLRHLEYRRISGYDRYSPALVDKHLQNEPVAKFGAGSVLHFEAS